MSNAKENKMNEDNIRERLMYQIRQEKENAIKERIGPNPCKKKREPVKISLNPLKGESTNRETRNVSVTATVPASKKLTSQFGRWK